MRDDVPACEKLACPPPPSPLPSLVPRRLASSAAASDSFDPSLLLALTLNPMAYPPYAYHSSAPPPPSRGPPTAPASYAAYPSYPPGPPPPPTLVPQASVSYPPPPAQSYRAPPPQGMDEQFRSFFRGHLAPLVQNSRPVIQNLTQIAADHATDYGKASIIAQEIARKILEVRCST